MNKQYTHQFVLDTLNDYMTLQIEYAHLGGCVMPEYVDTVESISNYQYVRFEYLKLAGIVKNLREYLGNHIVDIGLLEELDHKHLGD